jgi:hypothetical protein
MLGKRGRGIVRERISPFGFFPRSRCYFDASKPLIRERLRKPLTAIRRFDDDLRHNLVTINANKKGLHRCKPFERPET